MSVILEKTVQDATQVFLEKKYRRKARRGRIFSRTEMSTKVKYGRKRADGFFAFRHWLWGDYVVTVEAKSKKTLPAIRPYRDLYIFVKNSLEFGFASCLGLGGFMALFKMNDGLFQFLIPIYIWIFSALIYAIFTWRSYRHQTMDVIDQLKFYPANEKWLAFSKDSFKSLKKKNQKDLKKICKARGIGLIIYNNRITILVKPKYKWHFGKDFIKYYSKEKEVRRTLRCFFSSYFDKTFL